MRTNIQKTKNTTKRVYAFIDSQNLNLGVRSQGWKLDFGKFRQYLHDKYGVERPFCLLDIRQVTKCYIPSYRGWDIC